MALLLLDEFGKMMEGVAGPPRGHAGTGSYEAFTDTSAHTCVSVGESASARVRASLQCATQRAT